MQDAEQAILAFLRFARAYAAQALPWFAPALFRCTIVLDDRVAVAAIDTQLTIYFNPRVISSIRENYERESALSQVGFLWIHQISHVLREHADRAQLLGAEASLWNVAADLEINDSDWQGLEMPQDYPGLLPERFNWPNGLLAEQYYTKYLSADDEQRWRKQLPGLAVDEGSGVHGEARPWEINKGSAHQGVVITLTLDVIRKKVAEEMSKSAAQLTVGWLRWVEEILRPKVDWRKVLRHRVRTAINIGQGLKTDYSFRRINRRQSALYPVLLPALTGDSAARIAVVVDTSGSMSVALLGQAVAEVCRLLETFKLPIHVIPCDANAFEPIRIVGAADYVKLTKLKGGGGTDMLSGIEAAIDLRPKPDAIVVLTDGYTLWPTTKTALPLIFGILHDGDADFPRPPMPPWEKEVVVGIDLAEERKSTL